MLRVCVGAAVAGVVDACVRGRRVTSTRTEGPLPRRRALLRPSESGSPEVPPVFPFELAEPQRDQTHTEDHEPALEANRGGAQRQGDDGQVDRAHENQRRERQRAPHVGVLGEVVPEESSFVGERVSDVSDAIEANMDVLDVVDAEGRRLRTRYRTLQPGDVIRVVTDRDTLMDIIDREDLDLVPETEAGHEFLEKKRRPTR